MGVLHPSLKRARVCEAVMKLQCKEDDEHEFGEFIRVGKDVSFPTLEQVLQTERG